MCHGNGNCTDNRASNLRYDTPQANHDDSLRHGTRLTNAERWNCKLSADEVRAIRQLRGKHTCKELAHLFGTSPANVCNIQNGKRRIYA